MTDHAYNAEARHLREKRILAAQAMRAKGMKTALIAQAIGVGVATTQKYLVQTTIDEECKPKMPVPQKSALACGAGATSSRLMCAECNKTIARMG
jgi:hypothetical protein